MRRDSGITLFELLVVMVIFAILAAIGIPNLIGWMPKQRLSGATRKVFGDLAAARMKSINLNRNVKVFFFSDHEYRICDDADGNGTVASGEGDNLVRNIQNEYADVSFDLGGTSDPLFYPRGTGAPRSITLQNSSGSKSISISIAGRVKIN